MREMTSELEKDGSRKAYLKSGIWDRPWKMNTISQFKPMGAIIAN